MEWKIPSHHTQNILSILNVKYSRTRNEFSLKQRRKLSLRGVKWCISPNATTECSLTSIGIFLRYAGNIFSQQSNLSFAWFYNPSTSTGVVDIGDKLIACVMESTKIQDKA